MTWAIQEKKLKHSNIPNPNEIKIMAGAIRKPRDRALFILLYLTAGRISELVKVLCPKDITEAEVGPRKVLLIRLKNEKNRKRKFKDIPIPFEREPELIQMLYEYMDDMDMDVPIFKFGRIRAYQIIKKTTGFNPHFIRHIRLTHLAVYHDFNDQLLIRFAGWTDSRPAKNYMELKWTDILQKY